MRKEKKKEKRNEKLTITLNDITSDLCSFSPKHGRRKGQIEEERKDQLKECN